MPEDEWEEREKREEAFRREIATLKSMNRELTDFTGQIPGGFALRVERPLLSVICWSTATCEERKLAKALLVPDPSLVCYPGQSVLISPGASLSPRANGSVCMPPVPCKKQKEVTKQERSFVVVEEEREGCLTLPAEGPPLAGISGKR